jgi:carboxypeptidase T
MKFQHLLLTTLFAFAAALGKAQASTGDEGHYWIKVSAKDNIERTKIAEVGGTIEAIEHDYVIVLGSKEQLETLNKSFKVLVSFRDTQKLDFPIKDERFHNYAELTSALETLAQENPDLVRLYSIGKSFEGRDIWGLTLTSTEADLTQPGIVFFGGHHAREHLSVEMPLMLAQKLVSDYRAGDARVRNFLDNRSIYIIPVVNPDGKEFDIQDGNYKMWRKNRRPVNSKTFGVDLNRNYGFQWGTTGISFDPKSDVYPGTGPFSEPETQAVRDFYEQKYNINITLSFHTFSELILFPWGHKNERIPNPDYDVHMTMARKMAQWNGYVPQPSSDLYLASGDTTDWAYGEKGIVSFTFELDPKNMFSGGFYPGQKVIDPVFRKNWEPCLYLIEYSDDPKRVLNPVHVEYGLSTPIIK